MSSKSFSINFTYIWKIITSFGFKLKEPKTSIFQNSTFWEHHLTMISHPYLYHKEIGAFKLLNIYIHMDVSGFFIENSKCKKKWGALILHSLSFVHLSALFSLVKCTIMWPNHANKATCVTLYRISCTLQSILVWIIKSYLSKNGWNNRITSMTSTNVLLDSTKLTNITSLVFVHASWSLQMI